MIGESEGVRLGLGYMPLYETLIMIIADPTGHDDKGQSEGNSSPALAIVLFLIA